MRVLTMSRFFPKGHIREGQPTHFVEKIWSNPFVSIINQDLLQNEILNFSRHEYLYTAKHHTIRAGERWKPGDMVSLRVWSDKPYRSKQIEFAQVEVKKTWSFEMGPVPGTNPISDTQIAIDGRVHSLLTPLSDIVQKVSANDGLSIEDFISWFSIHPKKKGAEFRGQIVCWNQNVNY